MLNRILLVLCVCLFVVPCVSAETHFHHVHLNSTDPQAAIEFYTTHLSGERAKFDGADAVWTQKSWLLFNKVKQQPPYEAVSPLFHIGWGAEDMKAEFVRQINLGTTFQTVLTDGVTVLAAPKKVNGMRSAYVQAPDYMEVEIVEGHTQR